MKVVRPTAGLYEVVTCSESPHFITLATIYSVGWTEIASQPNWDPANYETVPPQLGPRPAVVGEGAQNPYETFFGLEDTSAEDHEGDMPVLSLIFF